MVDKSWDDRDCIILKRLTRSKLVLLSIYFHNKVPNGDDCE